jgi:hypothetical protein
MNSTMPEAEFDLGGGASLKLYSNRFVHEGGAALVEIIPYAHLASVRVAFERDARKLNRAIGLGIVAAILAALSGPMQGWFGSLATRTAGDGSHLETVLLTVFSALVALARMLPKVAVVLIAIAVALAGVFALGRTTFTLAFAATERAFSKLGRDRRLIEFAEILGSHLAERGR